MRECDMCVHVMCAHVHNMYLGNLCRSDVETRGHICEISFVPHLYVAPELNSGCQACPTGAFTHSHWL